MVEGSALRLTKDPISSTANPGDGQERPNLELLTLKPTEEDKGKTSAPTNYLHDVEHPSLEPSSTDFPKSPLALVKAPATQEASIDTIVPDVVDLTMPNETTKHQHDSQLDIRRCISDFHTKIDWPFGTEALKENIGFFVPMLMRNGTHSADIPVSMGYTSGTFPQEIGNMTSKFADLGVNVTCKLVTNPRRQPPAGKNLFRVTITSIRG